MLELCSFNILGDIQKTVKPFYLISNFLLKNLSILKSLNLKASILILLILGLTDFWISSRILNLQSSNVAQNFPLDNSFQAKKRAPRLGVYEQRYGYFSFRYSENIEVDFGIKTPAVSEKNHFKDF